MPDASIWVRILVSSVKRTYGVSLPIKRRILAVSADSKNATTRTLQDRTLGATVTIGNSVSVGISGTRSFSAMPLCAIETVEKYFSSNLQ